MKSRGNNNKLIASIVTIVTFVLYSMIVFVLIGYQGKQFLVAYVFTVLAYLLFLAAIWYICRNNSVKDMFMGVPIWKEGTVYVIAQMVVGILFMCLPHTFFKISVVTQTVLVGIYIMRFCSIFGAKTTIENIDNQVYQKRNYLAVLKTETDFLLQKEIVVSVQEALLDLAETIRFSDPMSTEELRSIEDDILNCISSLSAKFADISEEDKIKYIKQIKEKILYRNMRCKVLK